MSKNQLPLERFLELEATQPNKVYLRQPYNGKWIPPILGVKLDKKQENSPMQLRRHGST